MSLTQNQDGSLLLDLLRTENAIPPADDAAIPLTFALMVTVHAGKTLLIYNSWRKVWELPGGKIDPGETPETAAKRELHEETGQIAEVTTFVGLAKVQLKPDDRLEFGAIYTTTLTTLRPFTANDEASTIRWWDFGAAIDGHLTEIDRKLIELSI